MFQFTCPSRSTTNAAREAKVVICVSIHVPLAEHDSALNCPDISCSRFNSRAPRGARHDPEGMERLNLSFNSRAPRGARPSSEFMQSINSCFNSRAPRGARLSQWAISSKHGWFQFTCPSRSTTNEDRWISRDDFQFQFTCPSRSTTSNPRLLNSASVVSIHVPLAEHDCTRE